MSSPLKAEQPGRPAEPSMEEILASIRKIISDEDTKPAKPAPRAAPAPEPAEPATDAGPASQDDIDALMADFDAPAVPEPEAAEQADVLELTSDMEAGTDPDMEAFDADAMDMEAVTASPEGQGSSLADLDFIEPEPEPAPVAPPPTRALPRPEPAVPAQARAPAPVREEPAERLISAATDGAISAAFSQLTHTILTQNARTLEDLVQDMLRPMLKLWLDDNLPPLVERLVRAEIERVSRGGR